MHDTATLPAVAAGFKPTVPIRGRYNNWIGGQYVAPVRGQYFSNPTPITGKPLCEVARSTHEDIDRALDAAHAAASSWTISSATDRANIMNKLADCLEANLETLAFIETVDNGKPIRETTNADLPLAVDHFRYFAGAWSRDANTCYRMGRAIKAGMLAQAGRCGQAATRSGIGCIGGGGRESNPPTTSRPSTRF